jgi:hypothetical protein
MAYWQNAKLTKGQLAKGQIDKMAVSKKEGCQVDKMAHFKVF